MLALGQSIVPVIGLLALAFPVICVCLFIAAKPSNSEKSARLIRVASTTLTMAGAIFLGMSLAFHFSLLMCILYGLVPPVVGVISLVRTNSSSPR
jgi:hypothetical protein